MTIPCHATFLYSILREIHNTVTHIWWVVLHIVDMILLIHDWQPSETISNSGGMFPSTSNHWARNCARICLHMFKFLCSVPFWFSALLDCATVQSNSLLDFGVSRDDGSNGAGCCGRKCRSNSLRPGLQVARRCDRSVKFRLWFYTTLSCRKPAAVPTITSW